MDLDLTRQQTARQLGVWDEALRNWEAGRIRPGPKHLPVIEAFLGVRPIDPRDTLGPRLAAWRQTYRVSKARAGRLAGVHETTIARLERESGRWVSTKVRAAVEGLLNS